MDFWYSGITTVTPIIIHAAVHVIMVTIRDCIFMKLCYKGIATQDITLRARSHMFIHGTL